MPGTRRSYAAAAAFLAVGLLAAAPAARAQDGTGAFRSPPDRGWISLTGVVRAVEPTGFILGRDGRVVSVDMTDHEWFGEGTLAEGDRVTVTGATVDGRGESRSIDPTSVYVEKLDTEFHAHPRDEATGYQARASADRGAAEEWVALTGTVESVSGDEVVIDTGNGRKSVTVVTTDVPYRVEVEKGDRVTVYGDLARADFDQRRIEASSLIRLGQG